MGISRVSDVPNANLSTLYAFEAFYTLLTSCSGNGEDYKQHPNSEKAWEIEAYPVLLSEIRSALGPKKLISAAVPGLARDMLAFTRSTIPAISASLDFYNVMTCVIALLFLQQYRFVLTK